VSERQPTAPKPLPPDELGFERIVYEKTPPRATITLDRPEVLNAFDFQMLRELARACEDASWDDDIRVVVITGAGRAFCVGANLKEWAEGYLGKPNEYWKWFGAFKTCTTGCGRSASRRSLASTESRSVAATSSRWRATLR
jgi:enoyl-CoA hydratase/carnithine racemase